MAVDGGRIVAVDAGASIAARFRGRETLDAGGGMVLPGLVNAHGHAAHGAVPRDRRRPAADGLAAEVHLPRGEEQRHRGLREGGHPPGRPGDDPVRDHHVRGHVLLRGPGGGGVRRGRHALRARGDPHRVPGPRQQDDPGGPRVHRALPEAMGGASPVVAAVAPHSTYLASPETLKAGKALADRYQAPLLVHLSESRTSRRRSRSATARRPPNTCGTSGSCARACWGHTASTWARATARS